MLNLAELDRAEKIIAAGRKPPRSFVYTDMENPLEVLVAGVRPLLELADRLGKALEVMATKNAVSEEDFNRAFAVLADYRRAKGGK